MWVMENQQFLGERDSWSRAEQFGDGVFETLLVSAGICHALPVHAQRLESGLKRLNIVLPEQNLQDMLNDYVVKMVNHSALTNGVLKVIVSRGNSARGYGYDSQAKACVNVFYSPYVRPEKECYVSGIEVQHCNTQCAIQPQLAGLKHLNRLENVLAKSELTGNCFEGLMNNHLGFVIEGTMSNVFFENGGSLYTPDLSLSGVNGVMRNLIFKFCERKKISLNVMDIKRDNAEQFDSAFMCNSVMGVLPIKMLNKNNMAIGQVTRQLQLAIESGEIYA